MSKSPRVRGLDTSRHRKGKAVRQIPLNMSRVKYQHSASLYKVCHSLFPWPSLIHSQGHRSQQTFPMLHQVLQYIEYIHTITHLLAFRGLSLRPAGRRRLAGELADAHTGATKARGRRVEHLVDGRHTRAYRREDNDARILQYSVYVCEYASVIKTSPCLGQR